MKEWLNAKTYEYKQAPCMFGHSEWIEIPEWANYAYNNDQGVCFLKSEIGYNHPLLIWQRPTQPEPLPFIDDEPRRLNDQYAEIEQVRQAIKVKSGSDSDHAADAMSYGIMGLIADTNHVRQQSIEATLKERQSTYGSFEDVAFVTENIMAILAQARVNGLNDLPHTHRMALYMIASKMARIVNGDFNHVDGWHDIAGYATLIENLLKD